MVYQQINVEIFELSFSRIKVHTKFIQLINSNEKIVLVNNLNEICPLTNDKRLGLIKDVASS